MSILSQDQDINFDGCELNSHNFQFDSCDSITDTAVIDWLTFEDDSMTSILVHVFNFIIRNIAL